MKEVATIGCNCAEGDGFYCLACVRRDLRREHRRIMPDLERQPREDWPAGLQLLVPKELG